MGEGTGGAQRRSWFAVSIVAIVGVVALQSIVHLAVVLGENRLDTLVDLDRSNGVPDVVSTIALLLGAAGALALSLSNSGGRRGIISALAAALTLLALADVLHIGAHPTPASGKLVIVAVACVGVFLALVAVDSAWRARTTIAAAGILLLSSFLVTGLDNYDAQRFERERGDPTAEYEIVAKEGLELLGWSLVALALWDEVLRRRLSSRVAATARASRARAARTRRAA